MRGKKKQTKKTQNIMKIIIIIISIPNSTNNIHVHVFKTTFMCLRSIAGVPFDSVGRFRASLVLRTTCMRSCSYWIASCVAV